MLLGITSVLAQLINIVIMQLPVLQNCKDAAPSCLSDLLGIIQVAVLTLSITINCVLFVIYYPKPLSGSVEGRYVKFCIKMFQYFLFLCIAILLPALAIAGKDSSWTRGVGQFFGILCTVLSCVQYIPQIIRTWVTKRVGALSATTLAIQAPGSFFFAYTLAFRPGTDITTWGSFFVSGTFQVMLVCMCMYLARVGFNEDEDDDDVDDEEAIREPILSNIDDA